MSRLRAIAAALAVLTAAASASADELLTKEQFEARYVEAIRKEDPKAQVRVLSPDEVEVKWSNGGENRAFMGNNYARYVQQPEGLDHFLAQMVRLSHSPPDSAQTADQLVILVKPIQFIESANALRSGGTGKDKGPSLTRPLTDDLIEVVAFDMPEAYMYPPKSSLTEKFGSEEQGIWRKAEENTRRVIGSVSAQSIRPGIMLVVATDPNISPSLLLYVPLWRDPQLAGLGPHPAVMVTKKGLVAVDGDDIANLAWLQDFARNMNAKDPDVMTSAVYILRDGVWTHAARPAGQP